MYEELFQTPDRPFRATPDVRFYFAFDSMEQTRQTVLRVIRRAEGPAAVMGSVGLGKSLMAQLLADDLKDRFDVVRLHAARLCSRRAMLQSILFELQLPYRDLSEGELRLSLMERMEPAAEHAPDGLVLIVDEAQTLPTKLLEELRLITNFARQGQARARLVLLGGMHLEETFALPEMSSFNQRLAARCFLQPMNRQQTADFVRHQFACVGVDAKQTITRDALENVYIASEGIPRLANQVMDHALILAIASDQYPISAALIQEAWSDLQQLPMSWNQTEAATALPVEFGSIDDLDQDFELEPEGAEDHQPSNHSQMHWPTSGDLEDFGPTFSSPATPMSEPARMASPDRPIARGDAPTQTQPAARVVFDASTVFADRHKASTAPMRSQAGHAQESWVKPAALASTTPAPLAGDKADHDLFIFQEEREPNSNAAGAVSHNLFSGWERDRDALECDHQECQSAHSALRPTAYQVSDALPCAVPMPLARIEEPVVSDPFGQDFDEEFAVDASDVRRWQERQRAHRQAEQAKVRAHQAQTAQARAAQAAQVNAAPLQAAAAQAAHAQAADVRTAEPRDVVTWDTGSAQLEIEHIVVQPPLEGSFASNFVGLTSSTAGDERLQSEIEDLISQLNFSAFSLETDSVEQISPEFSREPASAAQYLDQHQRSDRGLDYASHPLRADEQPSSIQISSFDDRDMLVIDEEVPASVRHNHMPAVAPTTGTMSYPVLFQQLRG